MARIAGIATKKDSKGNITHVTVDVRKHREAITPVLEQLGVMPKTELQKMMESDEWISVEEARQQSLNHLNSAWKK